MKTIASARDCRLEEYLSYPELRIPMFQRDYVWASEEIEEFWDDLINESVQFLGSFILKDNNYNSSNRTGYLEIIDGQQRTISVLILLTAIARRLSTLSGKGKQTYEQNANKQAEDIHRLISKRDRNDLTKVLSFKLGLPSRTQEEYLWKVLKGEKLEKKSGMKNFQVAREKIDKLLEDFLRPQIKSSKKIDVLINLKNRILDIKIIEVLVPTDEDAYMIFETVNARGADLGAAELLKNYLFAHAEDQKVIHEEWEKIRKTLSEIDRRGLDITGFLRYFWISKYEHVSKKALYRAIKKKMSLNGSKRLAPHQMLKELGIFRESLESIFISSLEAWLKSFGSSRQDVRKGYEWHSYKSNLNYFGKSIQYLPIYSALVSNLKHIDVSNREFPRLLLAIEKINFIYSFILQEPTNKIDKLLSGIARDIHEQIKSGSSTQLTRVIQIGTSKIEDLIKESANKQKIYEFIADLNYNKPLDKEIIYFILINLEYEAGGYSRPLIQADLTLEHIYPKSVEKKGAVSKWPLISMDEYAKFGHGLGNITLLPYSGPQANGSAGEESFHIKKTKFLLPSTYALNRYFARVKKWNDLEMKRRLKIIQGKVWKRWGPIK